MAKIYKPQEGFPTVTASLEELQADYDSSLQQLKDNHIIKRIWSRDHTVWKHDPTEISNRLGWLDIAQRMRGSLPRLASLASDLQAENYRQVILLGMGGSSLAPEVFRKTFGVRKGFLDLKILDSTDPGTIQTILDHIDLAHTIFIVSTKSGGTPESLSFFKFFYQQVIAAVGDQKAGRHFIAITDPGSKLVDIASKYNFRETFLNDAAIGGRYSALSYFGLVPAALLGIDLEMLLDRAISSASSCDAQHDSQEGDTPCGILGTILGAAAKAGCDKATFFLSPEIESFGDWVEQLIAESTGKEGRGILPVVGEPIGSPSVYGNDRLFIHLQLEGNASSDQAKEILIAEGHPVITVSLKDRYDLGAQFFLWEMATAIAGYFLGINPFDQPNVESAKILTRKRLEAYQQTGNLAEPLPALSMDGISVFGSVPADSPEKALQLFLNQAKPGAYVAIQAYVEPTPEMDALLGTFRAALRDKTRLAATVGYGPRFLHSTGQLHKGDAGRGLFIQLTAQMPHDLVIPDEAGAPDGNTTFGVLKTAQVLGDYQALLDAGRKVIRFDLGANSKTNLKKLTNTL